MLRHVGSPGPALGVSAFTFLGKFAHTSMGLDALHVLESLLHTQSTPNRGRKRGSEVVGSCCSEGGVADGDVCVVESGISDHRH